jgi:hypothetical protein
LIKESVFQYEIFVQVRHVQTSREEWRYAQVETGRKGAGKVWQTFRVKPEMTEKVKPGMTVVV